MARKSRKCPNCGDPINNHKSKVVYPIPEGFLDELRDPITQAKVCLRCYPEMHDAQIKQGLVVVVEGLR